MRRLFAILLFIISAASAVFADGMYIPQIDPNSRNQDIKEPTQKAIIVHQDNREKLILQTTYAGKVSNFVWVVPTPNVIKVDKADSQTFERFHQMTAPRLKYWLNADTAKYYSYNSIKTAKTIIDVDVLGKKKIGVFDVTVLRAKKADDLIKWLNKNSYQVPENITPILDDYIKRGWVFTVSKVSAQNFKDKNKKIFGTLEPLAFEFYSKKPVFPLELTSLNKGKTKILIYTVAYERMECNGFDTLYASEKDYSKSGFHIDSSVIEDTFPNGTTERPLWITKLKAELSSKDMKKDLVLDISPKKENILPKDVYVPFYKSIGAILMAPVYILPDYAIKTIGLAYQNYYIMQWFVFPAFTIVFIMIVISFIKRNKQLRKMTFKYLLLYILLVAGYFLVKYFWMIFLNS